MEIRPGLLIKKDIGETVSYNWHRCSKVICCNLKQVTHFWDDFQESVLSATGRGKKGKHCFFFNNRSTKPRDIWVAIQRETGRDDFWVYFVCRHWAFLPLSRCLSGNPAAEAWPGNTDLWHWKVCKESDMEKNIPDLPVTCATSTFRGVTSALKRPMVNVMGPPKDENRIPLVLCCTHQKYGAYSVISLRCGCTHSKHLWTFIKKLYSGSDYYHGEKHEKLWQKNEKHKLFLFCIELSFQEKGYGFLDFIEYKLMNKTWRSFLNQVILLRL